MVSENIKKGLAIAGIVGLGALALAGQKNQTDASQFGYGGGGSIGGDPNFTAVSQPRDQPSTTNVFVEAMDTSSLAEPLSTSTSSGGSRSKKSYSSSEVNPISGLPSSISPSTGANILGSAGVNVQRKPTIGDVIAGRNPSIEGNPTAPTLENASKKKKKETSFPSSVTTQSLFKK